jgi:hypothetical protein
VRGWAGSEIIAEDRQTLLCRLETTRLCELIEVMEADTTA